MYRHAITASEGKKRGNPWKRAKNWGSKMPESGGTSPRNYSEVATKVEIQTRAVRGGFRPASIQKCISFSIITRPCCRSNYICWSLYISLSLILMPYLRVIHGSNTEPLKTLLQDYLMGRPDVSVLCSPHGSIAIALNHTIVYQTGIHAKGGEMLIDLSLRICFPINNLKMAATTTTNYIYLIVQTLPRELNSNALINIKMGHPMNINQL